MLAFTLPSSCYFSSLATLAAPLLATLQDHVLSNFDMGPKQLEEMHRVAVWTRACEISVAAALHDCLDDGVKSRWLSAKGNAASDRTSGDVSSGMYTLGTAAGGGGHHHHHDASSSNRDDTWLQAGGIMLQPRSMQADKQVTLQSLNANKGKSTDIPRRGQDASGHHPSQSTHAKAGHTQPSILHAGLTVGSGGGAVQDNKKFDLVHVDTQQYLALLRDEWDD